MLVSVGRPPSTKQSGGSSLSGHSKPWPGGNPSVLICLVFWIRIVPITFTILPSRRFMLISAWLLFCFTCVYILYSFKQWCSSMVWISFICFSCVMSKISQGKRIRQKTNKGVLGFWRFRLLTKAEVLVFSPCLTNQKGLGSVNISWFWARCRSGPKSRWLRETTVPAGCERWSTAWAMAPADGALTDSVRGNWNLAQLCRKKCLKKKLIESIICFVSLNFNFPIF